MLQASLPPEAFGNGVGGGRGRLLGLAAQAFGRRLELGHGLQGPSPTRCAAAPFAPVLFTAALRVGGRRLWSLERAGTQSALRRKALDMGFPCALLSAVRGLAGPKTRDVALPGEDS